MKESISAPSTDTGVLDHAANEPESPKPTDRKSSFDHELERTTRARAYFDDHDRVNAAIRRHPTRAVFIAAGIGFMFALLVR
jgi:hypothetical protein